MYKNKQETEIMQATKQKECFASDYIKHVIIEYKSGFTLVELSIVLVIIGLIVSGILVGQNLIRAAEIRSAIADIERIQTSVNSFRLKYNCIPGDCDKASIFLTGVTNGNGNSKVGQFPSPADNTEVWQFWYQLAQADLWSGTFTGTQGSGGTRHAKPGTNVPTSKMGNDVGYTVIYWGGYTDGNDWSPAGFGTIKDHVIAFGVSHLNLYETYAPAFTSADALSMDMKVDDGKPGTGNWMHISPLLFTGCSTTNNPSTAVYNTASGSKVCGFLIKQKL